MRCVTIVKCRALLVRCGDWEEVGCGTAGDVGTAGGVWGEHGDTVDKVSGGDGAGSGEQAAVSQGMARWPK